MLDAATPVNGPVTTRGYHHASRVFGEIRQLAPLVAMLVVVATLGCAREEPVEWGSPSRERADTLPGRLSIDAAGPLHFVNIPAPTDPTFTPPASACRASLRVAWSGSSGAERYAVWWSVRADSSAALLGARSIDDGATWSAPLPVDTLDRSNVGCNRPAPAIAADSQTGYVHVAYAMHAPEGTGVFFAHAMDRGTMYHAPVAIVYGDRLVDVDVAALHDTVAVAYTDPSMRYPHVGLALSRTLGHIFEVRIPAVARTGSGNAGASSPAVALAPGRIAVAWIEREIVGPPTLVTVAGRLHLAGAR
jgi:hypothetical protein